MGGLISSEEWMGVGGVGRRRGKKEDWREKELALVCKE